VYHCVIPAKVDLLTSATQNAALQQASCISVHQQSTTSSLALDYCAHYHVCMYVCIYTQPFNSPFSETTRVSQYQKGKTNLDFTEVRDSEWQWHQLGHMQVCNSLQTDNHASTHHSVFLQAGCPSCCPTNSVCIYMSKCQNEKVPKCDFGHFWSLMQHDNGTGRLHIRVLKF